VVLVVPPGTGEDARRRLMRCAKLYAVVVGGRRRQESVAAGIKALPPCGIVLVHDVARPCVSRDVIRRVIRGTRRWGACVPAVPVADTVKRKENGRVVATLDRSTLVAVQTPQGFRRSLCDEMYRRTETVTDDALLAEMCGHQVGVVRGDERNIKVTVPGDLLIARVLLDTRQRKGR